MTSVKSILRHLQFADLFYYQQQPCFDAEGMSLSAPSSLSSAIAGNPIKLPGFFRGGKTVARMLPPANPVLKALMTTSAALTVIYFIVFSSLRGIPSGNYSVIAASLPLLLSLASLTMVYTKNEGQALFMITWLTPSVILMVSLYNAQIDYSKVLIIYMLSVLFLSKSQQKRIMGFIWLTFTYVLIQLHHYSIATDADNYNSNLVALEIFMLPVFCLIAFMVLTKIKNEFTALQAEINNQKETLEKKNYELEDLVAYSEAQREKLKRSIQLKDKLIAVISHDVRVPVNSFRFLIDNYERGYIPEKMLLEGILECRKDLVKVDNMVIDLVNWARTGNAKPENEMISSTDLREITDSVISIYSLCAKNKNLTLIPVFDMTPDTRLFISKQEIAIVMRNLVSNAIKFSNPGNNIVISVKADGHAATLSVKDSGTGMHPSMLQRLNGNGVISTMGTFNEIGLGVGLSIVFDVINEHSLDYEIESELNTGTVFSIQLPMKAA